MSVLKWSDPSLLQTPPSFSQAPGLVPASTLADGGECRLALGGALDQIHLNRWRADASAAGARDAGSGSVGEFPSASTAPGSSPHGRLSTDVADPLSVATRPKQR